MSQIAKMIINDPESFHLLTTDAKERIIKAATNTVNIQAALAKNYERHLYTAQHIYDTASTV